VERGAALRKSGTTPSEGCSAVCRRESEVRGPVRRGRRGANTPGTKALRGIKCGLGVSSTRRSQAMCDGGGVTIYGGHMRGLGLLRATSAVVIVLLVMVVTLPSMTPSWRRRRR